MTEPMTPSQAAQEKHTSPRTEAGRDFARRISHFNILGDIGSILAIEREAAAATPSLDGQSLYRLLWQETWAFSGLMPIPQWEELPPEKQAVWKRVAARLDEGSATPDQGEKR